MAPEKKEGWIKIKIVKDMYRKEAIKVVRGFLNSNASDALSDALKTLIPELKESEDNEIRNEIIAFVEQAIHRGGGTLIPQEQEDRWIAWLEKQGEKDSQVILPTFTFDDILALECCMKEVEKKDEELYNQLQSLHNRVHDAYWLGREEQKSPDKVEPKFKSGDWIFYSEDHCGGVRHITKIDEKGYYIERNGYPHGIIPFNHEIYMKLWTIEDAKDGDVLVLFPSKGAERPFIFKEIKNSGVFKNAAFYPVDFHCTLVKNVFRIKSEFEYIGETNENFAPATKEQRDILFQKMNEAGYGWDAENKIIKKL